MMNNSSWRRNSQEPGAPWGQKEVGEAFAASESVAGTAGGSRTNHSTAGDNSTVNPKRTPAKSDASYYENESVMLWSDNPEKEYFTYMLQKEQENRAKQGKAEDDSLIGKSTLEEIQQEFSKWHQQGGEIDPHPGHQDPNTSFPALSSPRMSSHERLTLDGFSLATDEKSPPKQIPVQVNFPTSPLENSKSELFPDVIYVTDTPATSVELMSRPSQDSSKSDRRNKSVAIILLIVGIICLAAAAVAIYISVSSSKHSKTSNSASSLQQGADNQAISWGPVDGTSLRPTSLPTIIPSVVNQITTSLPTRTASEEETAAPTVPPSATSMIAGTEATTSPSTILPTETPSAASGNPSSKPTSGRPSFPPTSKPTDEPTDQPTNWPTNDPTNDPNSKVLCGCRNCGFAINRMADGYTCGERMNFLVFERGYSELEACRLVANTEFPQICGPFCDPDTCTKPFTTNLRQTPNPNTGTSSAPAQENNAYPLGLCDGVCENDDDCATGLVCFHRDSGAPVPFYCAGIEEANQADFCVLP